MGLFSWLKKTLKNEPETEAAPNIGSGLIKVQSPEDVACYLDTEEVGYRYVEELDDEAYCDDEDLDEDEIEFGYYSVESRILKPKDQARDRVRFMLLPQGTKKHIYTQIGAGAFMSALHLQYVETPSTMESIGDNAFSDCKHLKGVLIDGNECEIGRNAFAGCENLERASFTNGVKSIGMGAFRNCKSLETVVIPTSMQWIDSGAFEGCTNLREVMIGNPLLRLDLSAFEGCPSIERLTLPLAWLPLSRLWFKTAKTPEMTWVRQSTFLNPEDTVVGVKRINLAKVERHDGERRTVVCFELVNQAILPITLNHVMIFTRRGDSAFAANAVYLDESMEYELMDGVWELKSGESVVLYGFFDDITCAVYGVDLYSPDVEMGIALNVNGDKRMSAATGSERDELPWYGEYAEMYRLEGNSWVLQASSFPESTMALDFCDMDAELF